jgi:rhodanese-related sulfurtransferase
MRKRIGIVIGAIAGVFMFVGSVPAMTPLQLKQMLDRGEAVTVIDIRSTPIYVEGHIPGAINIPAAVIARKRLPALGRVVVYGDGIRSDLVNDAVSALSDRPGIRAEALEGGFAAWEALHYTNTRPQGLRKTITPYMSYQELEKTAAENRDIVFVDMRGSMSSTEGSVLPGPAGALPTDISEKFPGQPVLNLRGVKSEPGVVSAILDRGGADHHRFLFILIDEGDGAGEKIAERLLSSGMKRIAVLAGGERILERDGRPETMRKESQSQ